MDRRNIALAIVLLTFHVLDVDISADELATLALVVGAGLLPRSRGQHTCTCREHVHSDHDHEHPHEGEGPP